MAAANVGVSRQTVAAGTEYVYVGTPEETLLETYFVMLSKFNFERAKDHCDKERENKGASAGANWCEFMIILAKLAMAEQNYHTLNFTGRSWYLKKGNLKAVLEQLLLDAKKVHEVYYYNKGGTGFSWEKKMSELLSSLMEYITVRRDMTEIYKSLELLLDASKGSFPSCVRLLKDTSEKHKDGFQHSYLTPLKNNWRHEVGILNDLLKAQRKMASWQFYPSLMALQNSHIRLEKLCGLQQPGMPVTDSSPRLPSIKSRPHIPHSSSTMMLFSVPPLYRWLSAFHTATMAKFTLYFYQLLSKSGMMAEVKGLSSKFSTDYLQSFHMLVRQTQVCCVCLMFDTSGSDHFKGPDYHFPSTPSPELTGLKRYPIMVAVPQDFELFPHQANIVSMVMSRDTPHQQGTNPAFISQYDGKLNCAYHLLQLEPQITLVAIVMQHRRRDKDTPIINKLTVLANKLKNQNIYQMLKQGVTN